MIRVKMCIIVSCASFGVYICNNVHIVFILQCLRDYIVYIYTLFICLLIYIVIISVILICLHIYNVFFFSPGHRLILGRWYDSSVSNAPWKPVGLSDFYLWQAVKGFLLQLVNGAHRLCEAVLRRVSVPRETNGIGPQKLHDVLHEKSALPL